MRPRVAWATTLALLLALTGCSSIPKDPDGTLERVQSTGVLRAAASPSEGRVVTDRDKVIGIEADLVEGFAESVGARVEWHVMGEESAVDAMDRHEIDLLAGGLTDTSPYAAEVGLTRPYAETTDNGETLKHVLGVPMGENAMLSELERYLDEAAP